MCIINDALLRLSLSQKNLKFSIVRITFRVKEGRAVKDKEPDSTLQLCILLIQML